MLKYCPPIMVITAQVKMVTVSGEQAGQRVDKFLLKEFKLVPQSRIYKALRKGEVRVNKQRVEADYQLKYGDLVRIPPLKKDANTIIYLPTKRNILTLLAGRVLYENDGLIVLNKPAGLAVHGGAGIKHSVIEAMRQLRPEIKTLELVHRLDRATSGCLLLAKKTSVLRQLHVLFREHAVSKTYLCLCRGHWRGQMRRVKAALSKHQLRSGERFMRVDDEGKESLTTFHVIEHFEKATLMKAELATGRTHQIRVHANSVKHPLAGDDRYGDLEFNQYMQKQYGLKRLFLHAEKLVFICPLSKQKLTIEAPLEVDLATTLSLLRNVTA